MGSPFPTNMRTWSIMSNAADRLSGTSIVPCFLSIIRDSHQSRHRALTRSIC